MTTTRKLWYVVTIRGGGFARHPEGFSFARFLKHNTALFLQ